MQSNLAIVEEMARIADYLDPNVNPSCTNDECKQHGLPVGSASAEYKLSGKTASGSIRYQCLVCKKTFSSVVRSGAQQRMTHKNRDVFMMLVNKSPLKRIAAMTDLTMDTVYRKMDSIHKQCMLFAGDRKRLLLKMKLPTRYIAVDRLVFVVNWKSRKDRRNVNLLAVASADVETGFVFGMHVNYDADADAQFVQDDMIKFGDHKRTRPFRRYARLWLPQDYMTPVGRPGTPVNDGPATNPVSDKVQLTERIETAYVEALSRDDVEAGNSARFFKPPPVGMQVHEQSVLSAHMQFLSRLLNGAEKLRFFVDQESGIRAAFMAAFVDRIQTRTADAWCVSVLKEVTIDKKRKSLKQVRDRFAAAQEAHPELSEKEIELLLMKEEMARTKAFGKWNDRWLAHPMPTMSEPAKKVCWLTDLGDYDEEHAARLYLKATLHPVDRFFMQVRRRLSLAERPIASASNKGCVWNGYSAYQPRNLVDVLEIYRVFYNYCEAVEDKRTPAMRLGLAKG